MRIICFSSFTFAYLDRARVLFSTVKEHHPDWRCIALITDKPPAGVALELADEPFDVVVYSQDLKFSDYDQWLFKHDVVEACTAVKGPFIFEACASGADAVVYLDPDTALLNSLSPLEALLEEHDIVLTPHQIHPDRDDLAIVDNEITSLKTGIYNLGFVAIRTKGDGLRFAEWWDQRCRRFCFDDIPNGLFVDQRWCDHVPGLFDNVKILRDPGYNVASWNLSHRTVSIEKDGQIYVNGSPLRFWHFTKLGKLGDTMTKRYAKNNFEVYELWSWYKRKIQRHSDPRIPKGYWAYATYRDGTLIRKEDRVLYRSRPDIQEMFPDPYRSGSGSFQEWANHAVI